MIATRQTWVGQQITKYNNGVTFEGENVQDFHDALIKLHKNYLNCCRNSIMARNNNENAFLRFVKNNSINKINSIDDTSTAYEWNLINLQRVIQYKDGVINEITMEKEEMIKKRDEIIKNHAERIKALKISLKRKDEKIKHILESKTYRIGRIIVSPLIKLKKVLKK